MAALWWANIPFALRPSPRLLMRRAQTILSRWLTCTAGSLFSFLRIAAEDVLRRQAGDAIPETQTVLQDTTVPLPRSAPATASNRATVLLESKMAATTDTSQGSGFLMAAPFKTKHPTTDFAQNPSCWSASMATASGWSVLTEDATTIHMGRQTSKATEIRDRTNEA